MSAAEFRSGVAERDRHVLDRGHLSPADRDLCLCLRGAGATGDRIQAWQP